MFASGEFDHIMCMDSIMSNVFYILEIWRKLHNAAMQSLFSCLYGFYLDLHIIWDQSLQQQI